MATPEKIILRELSRSFGRTFALHRLSTTFHAGRITGLVGGNGAGKSTLLSILATLDHPTAGSLHFDDLNPTQFARRHRHRIGWVAHQTLLYEELTALENLVFYAQMYGLDQVQPRAQRWLQRVGLEEAENKLVRSFSRGMKQRLTIARALLPNPQLLLLDEPATGLDQSGTALVADLLNELRERGRMIILVSHNFTLLEEVVDDLVILRRGKLVAHRPLEEFPSLQEAYGELGTPGTSAPSKGTLQ